MKARVAIITALLDPDSVRSLSLAQWDVLVRQGRRANLLARLNDVLARNELIHLVPAEPRMHLVSASRLVDRQTVAMHWEIQCIAEALAATGTRVILLKGAAYLATQLPAATGRLFSDIDIMVPKQDLGAVESALMIHGWRGSDHDQYDQRYYRKWMHEIPPMHHVRRGTTIDVHHAILPETARIKVDTPALLAAARPLPSHKNIFALKPADMILHSATHLFHEGELEKGLRDLFDLDSIFRHFGKERGLWEELVPRAVSLGLTRPLYYAVRYASQLIDTPIPDEVVRAANVGRPSWLVARLMDWCYRRALLPDHLTCNTRGTRFARFALYVRSHWIRMPFPLLIAHLTRKAFKRTESPEIEDAAFVHQKSEEDSAHTLK